MTNFFDSLTGVRKSSRSYPVRANALGRLGAGPVFGAILALAVWCAGGAQGSTISFQNGVNSYSGTRDTYIAPGGGSDPDTNYGSATSLTVFEREPSLNNFYRSLVGFNLSSVAPGTIVNSATLKLYQDISVGTQNVTNSLFVVAQADKGWTQSGATWNNQAASTTWAGNTSPLHAPALQPEDPTNTGGLVANVDYNSTAVAFAVTPSTSNAAMTLTLDAAGIAAIQDWINNPTDNSGFFIRQPTGSNSVDAFWSSNEATVSLRPLLTLDVTLVPEPSSSLLLLVGAAGLWVVRRRRKYRVEISNV